MATLKKYKHDNKEGYDHAVVCPRCKNTSLMDNGQYVGVETSICPHCDYNFSASEEEQVENYATSNGIFETVLESE